MMTRNIMTMVTWRCTVTSLMQIIIAMITMVTMMAVVMVVCKDFVNVNISWK
jgi:hypothetical protein